jgi:hypothetical protein
MSDKEIKGKEELQRITDELAEQARQTPGSPDEAESKDRRAQAEKKFRETSDQRSG